MIHQKKERGVCLPRNTFKRFYHENNRHHFIVIYVHLKLWKKCTFCQTSSFSQLFNDYKSQGIAVATFYESRTDWFLEEYSKASSHWWRHSPSRFLLSLFFCRKAKGGIPFYHVFFTKKGCLMFPGDVLRSGRFSFTAKAAGTKPNETSWGRTGLRGTSAAFSNSTKIAVLFFRFTNASERISGPAMRAHATSVSVATYFGGIRRSDKCPPEQSH